MLHNVSTYFADNILVAYYTLVLDQKIISEGRNILYVKVYGEALLVCLSGLSMEKKSS